MTPVASVVTADQEMAELAPQLDVLPELEPVVDDHDEPVELGSLSDPWLDVHTTGEKEL